MPTPPSDLVEALATEAATNTVEQAQASGLAVQVDATDPLTAILAWAFTHLLTLAVSRASGRTYTRVERTYRYIIPTAAMVLAGGVRVVIDYSQGHDLTLATGARVFAAGAAAVWLHAQARGAVKAMRTRPLPEEK